MPINRPIDYAESCRFPETNGESVISQNHPDNVDRPRDNTRTYTYRQRAMKLNFTLGWEMEANHVPTRKPNGVDATSDGSVNGDGAEFVVLPAVTKSPRYVLGLLKELVHAPRLNTDESCGFHVHVSASNLGNLTRMRQWAIATEHLAMKIEDLAFKAVPDSRAGNQYCRKIVPITNGTTFDMHKYNNSRRYHWLNIVEMFRPNGIRTIENRLLGHTHRWKYVLAWSLFTMELARRGWDLSNKPFDIDGHVAMLSGMLKDIAKDIKPLSKRAEPIPQWVYKGLKEFGIESNAWDRPLARLSETESDLRGEYPRYYSDDQPELDNEIDEDHCSCGCGDEVTCDAQLHRDGDCNNNECYRCHENGECDGSEECDYCQELAHENGDECGRSMCRHCNPERLTPIVPRSTGVRASDVFNIEMTSGVTTGRITANPSPQSLELQREIDAIQNATVDNAALQAGMYRVMHDTIMYGTGVTEMLYNGPVPEANLRAEEIDGRVCITGTRPVDRLQVRIDNINNDIDRADEEHRAAQMLDTHEDALSIDREFNQGGR